MREATSELNRVLTRAARRVDTTWTRRLQSVYGTAHRIIHAVPYRTVPYRTVPAAVNEEHDLRKLSPRDVGVDLLSGMCHYRHVVQIRLHKRRLNKQRQEAIGGGSSSSTTTTTTTTTTTNNNNANIIQTPPPPPTPSTPLTNTTAARSRRLDLHFPHLPALLLGNLRVVLRELLLPEQRRGRLRYVLQKVHRQKVTLVQRERQKHLHRTTRKKK